MSTAKIVGIVLIVLGALTFVYKGFTYNDKETILDLGPIKATATTQERVNVPIWVGGILLGAGVVLLLTGGRTSKA